MIYQWKQNRFAIGAQAAGNELERIKKSYGGIMPKDVVNESRPTDSVLHKCFEWDDRKAAEAYREVQAREIIRNIVVVKAVGIDDSEPVIIRAFVPVAAEDNESKKYISIDDALSDEDYTKQVIEQAKSEMIALKKKYGDLLQFADMVKTFLLSEVKLKEGIAS
jgi:hypothetical protein